MPALYVCSVMPFTSFRPSSFPQVQRRAQPERRYQRLWLERARERVPEQRPGLAGAAEEAQVFRTRPRRPPTEKRQAAISSRCFPF